ncbi:MAG: hypothetical protein KBD63_07775 [Bacteriovoracaceae bacterium]|nr:hypothetical protein [Bacteriovoracaceae bacterium]
MTKNLTSTPLALTPSWLKLCQTTIFSSHHQTSLRPFKMSWNLKGKLGYAK